MIRDFFYFIVLRLKSIKLNPFELKDNSKVSFKHLISPNVNSNKYIVEHEKKCRTAKEVAEKSYLSFLLYLVSTSRIQASDVYGFVEKYDIFFSIKKEELLKLENYDSFNISEESWKIEQLYIFLWTLNIIEHIEYPIKNCDENTIISVFFKDGNVISPNKFTYENKNIKPIEDITKLFNDYFKLFEEIKYLNLSNSNFYNHNVNVIENRYYALKWVLNADNRNVEKQPHLMLFDILNKNKEK